MASHRRDLSRMHKLYVSAKKPRNAFFLLLISLTLATSLFSIQNTDIVRRVAPVRYVATGTTTESEQVIRITLEVSCSDAALIINEDFNVSIDMTIEANTRYFTNISLGNLHTVIGLLVGENCYILHESTAGQFSSVGTIGSYEVYSYHRTHSLSYYVWSWYGLLSEEEVEVDGRIGIQLEMPIHIDHFDFELVMSNYQNPGIDDWASKDLPVTLDNPTRRFANQLPMALLFIIPFYVCLTLVFTKWHYLGDPRLESKHPLFKGIRHEKVWNALLWMGVPLFGFGIASINLFSHREGLLSFWGWNTGLVTPLIILLAGYPLLATIVSGLFKLDDSSIDHSSRIIVLLVFVLPFLYATSLASSAGPISGTHLAIPLISASSCFFVLGAGWIVYSIWAKDNETRRVFRLLLSDLIKLTAVLGCSVIGLALFGAIALL